MVCMKITTVSHFLTIQHLDFFSETKASGRLLSATELAQERVGALTQVFRNKWWLDSLGTRGWVSRDVRSILNTDGMKVFNSIPDIWKYRLTTSTCFFQLGKNMCYTEIDPSFPDGFDFSDFSDGGVHIKAPIDILDAPHSNKRRLLPVTEYLWSIWGGITPNQLYHHPLFRSIIPDDMLRRDYIACLHILDYFSFFNRGIQSLWRPGEMKKWYIRWIALGFKGECVYPPNLTTRGHHMIYYVV